MLRQVGQRLDGDGLGKNGITKRAPYLSLPICREFPACNRLSRKLWVVQHASTRGFSSTSHVPGIFVMTSSATLEIHLLFRRPSLHLRIHVILPRLGQ